MRLSSLRGAAVTSRAATPGAADTASGTGSGAGLC